MTPPELEAKARELYESGSSVRPTWAQLGDTTKAVWREYVLAGQTPDNPRGNKS